jgi:Molecular chaperone, HSP90 family
MINQELLDVDALFSRHDIPSLGAYCVKNIDSPRSISRLIEAEGWTPVESQMKVTNVSGLINSLGGSALYGNNDFVPLRELVQNASDAIRAKRLMDERGGKWGDVHIRVKDVSDGTIIEVEDNGIGMSESVLTGPFLVFWNFFLAFKFDAERISRVGK